MSIDTYKLTSMEEPTDEVLSQLMREAVEEASQTNSEATARFFEEIKKSAAAFWYEYHRPSSCSYRHCRAREAGYFIRLFFVSTNHPSINSSRIAKRVMKGGHDVPIPKIISRYQKSIVNCKRCATLADRVYVYDNSIEDVEARLLFRMSDGHLFKRYTDDIPVWAQTIIG